MKKFYLITLMMLLMASVYAQDGGCYQRTRSKGITFYNNGDMANAERAFRQAQNCADKPENNDLDEWIKKVGGDKLGLSHSNIVFTPEGNTVEIGVFGAHGNVEVTGIPGWCTYEKIDKNGDMYIAITSFTNDTKYKRTGVVTVKSDIKTATLNVSQDYIIKETTNNTYSITTPPDGGGVDNGKGFYIAFRGGINIPKFKVSSSNVLTSVMDYGLTDVSGMTNSETPNYKSSVGLELEMLMDIRLSKHLFLETGLGYSRYIINNTFSNNRLVYTIHQSGYDDKYYFDYNYKEKYKMSYINIPLMLNYRFQLGKKIYMGIHTGLVFGIGVSGKLELEGNVDYELYKTNDDENYWYSKSYVEGTVDLFSTSYDLSQQYTTGSCPQYYYRGNNNAAPYKKINYSWDMGLDFDLGIFQVGMHYSLGLSNMANDEYWTSGDRVCGLLFLGDMIKSYAQIRDYKQKMSVFNVVIGFKF